MMTAKIEDRQVTGLTLGEREKRLLVELVPSNMHYALTAYFERRELASDFLRAVLENNLVRAATAADDINRARLADIAGWLFECAPLNVYGSPEKVEGWLYGHEDGLARPQVG